MIRGNFSYVILIIISLTTSKIVSILINSNYAQMTTNIIFGTIVTVIIKISLEVLIFNNSIDVQEKNFWEKVEFIQEEINHQIKFPLFLILLICSVLIEDWSKSLIWCLSFVARQCLTLVFNMASTQLSSIKKIKQLGLDCGSVMAHHFFFGYLYFVITNDEETFEEKLESYENSNKIHFKHRKLFILISSSGFCPPDLKELSNGKIECAKPLMALQKDIAGIRRRHYQNSVYKLKVKDGPFYIVLEGATPLFTLYTCIQNSNTNYAKFAKQHLNDIIFQFYTTLKSLIDERVEFRTKVELVLYDDQKEPDLGKKLLEDYFR